MQAAHRKKNALIYTKFTSIVMRVFLANLRAMCVVSFAMVVHSNLLCNFYLAVVVPSLMPPPLTALLPTRVAIKKNSRRDAKQKEVIPLALSDLFQFYKIHQGTVPGYFTRTPQLQIENALFSTSFSLAAM